MKVDESRGKVGRHETAVSNSLGMADAAASRGDYRDAVSWLEAVRATGDLLTDEYEHKRAEWIREIAWKGE